MPHGSRFEKYWHEKFQSFASIREDDAGISGWQRTGLETRLRHFLHFCKLPPPGALWLDAGCGAGTYSRLLAERGMRVMAVDYSPASVIKARARSNGKQPVTWVIGDLNCLPAAGSFHGVLCLGVTQTLEEPLPVLRQLAAAGAPNAELWIDGLNRFCLVTMIAEAMRILRRQPRHLRYDNPWRLRALMKQAGLNQVSLSWIPMVPARWHRFQWLFETRAVRALLKAVPPVAGLICHSFLLHGRKHGHSASARSAASVAGMV